MSWQALAPRERRAVGKHPPAVTLSVNKDAARYAQRLQVMVYLEHLPAGSLAWWKQGAAVEAHLGTGEHAGLVRITVGGPFRLSAPKGRKRADGSAPPCGLLVAGLPGMPGAGLSRVPARFELYGDALIVTLPWAADVKGAAKLDLPPPVKPLYAPPPPPAATLPVRAAVTESYAVIQAWAIEHRLGSPTHGFDLLQVNRRRVELGERPFIIRKTARFSGAEASA